MNDDEFKAYLEGQGYHHVRKLNDDAWVGITKMLFTWALCIELDMSGYNRRYCYTSQARAEEEIGKMNVIEDIPTGWLRQLPERQFFTISGVKGFPLTIGPIMGEGDIIDEAMVRTRYEGRPWNEDATLEEALAELRHEGRVFETFPIPDGARDFSERATAIGKNEEAAFLVNAVMRRYQRIGTDLAKKEEGE